MQGVQPDGYVEGFLGKEKIIDIISIFIERLLQNIKFCNSFFYAALLHLYKDVIY